MREVMKRLLRLTPLVAFTALDAVDIEEIIAETFDAAVAGLDGRHITQPERELTEAPQPSPEVVRVETVTLAARDDDGHMGAARDGQDFDTISHVALGIARRTGRVTSITLREVVPITADEAREVFSGLIDQGALVRRGVRRGTYYVLAEGSDPEATPLLPGPTEPPSDSQTDEAALRRLLRRPR